MTPLPELVDLLDLVAMRECLWELSDTTCPDMPAHPVEEWCEPCKARRLLPMLVPDGIPAVADAAGQASAQWGQVLGHLARACAAIPVDDPRANPTRHCLDVAADAVRYALSCGQTRLDQPELPL